MSRIGKQPIIIPQGVTVALKGDLVTIQGSKGTLEYRVHPHVRVGQKENALVVTVKNPDEKSDRALWGLTRSLLFNMVHGVSKGYEKKLEIHGVGFRAAVSGTTLTLQLGFSHPVEYQIHAGIEAKVEKNVITLTGFDKYLVGQSAAEIRALKKPEPYKGKGIRYVDEVVRRKAGKVAKGVTEGGK